MSKETALLDPNGEPYYSDEVVLSVMKERSDEELLYVIRGLERNAYHMGILSVQLDIKKALGVS